MNYGRIALSLIGVALLCRAIPVLHAEPPANSLHRKRLLLIGIDGTRPDGVAKAATPHIDDLKAHGSYADNTRIFGERFHGNDSISGPGWTSNLTGVWADKHGVMDNGFSGHHIEAFPHFFKRLKNVRPDAKTVSFVSWEPIHKFILSNADIAGVEPLPEGESIPPTDLKVPAKSLGINTRDDEWHHLLAKRKGDQVSLYLDGRLAGQVKDTTGSFDLGGDFYFAGRDSRTEDLSLDGQLDDVRLWNRALTEEEVLQAAGTERLVKDQTGLLLHWTFEEDQPSPNDKTAATFWQPIASDQPARFARAERGHKTATRTLDLTEFREQDHGVRTPFTPELRAIPQGDFTIETRFRTTKPGRNILLGNYKNGVGALNLELGTNNTVRVYLNHGAKSSRELLALENRRDGIIAAKAAKVLTTDNPTAMFAYFHQVDATGHSQGFGPTNPDYVKAIENVDGHIGTILHAMKSRLTYQDEDWLVIVCTDHGGLGRNHGGGYTKPEIRNVFLLVSGPSAKVGSFETQTYLVDIAATALRHLTGNIDPTWQLDGKPVGLK